MLKDKLAYILLFACFLSFGQSKMKLASIQQASGGGAVYVGNNAADPVNEVDGVANTDANGNFTITSVSTSPTSQNGTYSIKFTQAAGVNTLCDGYITLVGVNNGDNVTVTVYWNEVVGSNWRVGLQSLQGWTSEEILNPVGGGSWEQITFTANTATQDNPNLTIRGTSSSDTGDEVAIDNIVITVN